MNRLGAVAAAILLASMVLGPATSATGSESTTIRVLQLNICHSGIVGCYTGNRVLARAADVITATRPHVLSVNEACSGDVEPLRRAMGAAATLFVPAERPNGRPMTCRNGQPFGNIVMTTAPARAAGIQGRFTDQVRGDEMRVWACLPAADLTACTTHLTARGTATAMSQCVELMANAAPLASSGPVIVAGDLNLHYADAQSCTPTGFHRKGDGDVQHVLATTALTFAATTQISMSGTTDHPAWLVTLSGQGRTG